MRKASNHLVSGFDAAGARVYRDKWEGTTDRVCARAENLLKYDPEITRIEVQKLQYTPREGMTLSTVYETRLPF